MRASRQHGRPRPRALSSSGSACGRVRAHVAAPAGEGGTCGRSTSSATTAPAARACSGARLQRPGLDRRRAAVAAAALDRVLVTAPDRRARTDVHQRVLREELERPGGPVDFLERPLSQDPPDHRLLQMRRAVAEYERPLIAERLRRGRLRKRQAGVLLPWTRAPDALRLDPERPRDPAGVRVEEAEAGGVRELFAQYLEPGGRLAGLAKHLETLGVPPPTGKRCWPPNTRRLILTHPASTGPVYSGRRRVRRARLRCSARRPVGHHGQSATPAPPETWRAVAPIPALGSQDQFDQVPAQRAQNQQVARRHNTAPSSLVRALVSCGVCPLGGSGRWSHPGYASSGCRGKTHPIQSGRPQRCRARFLPAQRLDELVWGDLCDLLTHPQSLHQALERAHGGHGLRPRRARAAPGAPGAPRAGAAGTPAAGGAARTAERGLFAGRHPAGRVPAPTPDPGAPPAQRQHALACQTQHLEPGACRRRPATTRRSPAWWPQ